ncbi:Ig-like domain-containing protein [Caloramator sp. Dgby_cultured_2]|uniref:Ig-like domain-containing protein n=1 Tax=Caloramator sp. Dgby_cultured_2 TaxID=3029174 RepID=UPI00237E6507|nr:Ig-like domain-containing protein [Caloramator sp. Dgby_cultured_2]WDU82666.1 SwmB domain-containing protein [Caloramator sp. Dgby_cultured_2]
MAKAKKMLSLALAVLVTVGSMGLAPASAATKKVDYYQIALTNINKYLKPQLTITKQSQSEEDLKLLQSYYRSLKIHMSRITNVKQKAAISKQLMELSQEIVAVTAQVKAQIAAADAVEAFELAALTTQEEIAAAEALYAEAVDKVQDIADRTVRMALMNRINDKKAKLDAAKKGFEDVAATLKAAEDAVAAYEAAKLTTLDEVKAARDLEKKAADAVAKVTDADKKAALEKRIADQKKKVDEEEIKLLPVAVKEVKSDNLMEILVVFNQDVCMIDDNTNTNWAASALNTANYKVNGNAPTKVEKIDSKAVRLTAAAFTNGSSVAVEISGIKNVALDKTMDKFTTAFIAADTTAPTATATVDALRKVTITFSEPMSTVGTVYVGTTQVNFTLDSSYKKATATLDASFEAGKAYDVKVFGAKDIKGNWIAPNPTVATITIPVDNVKPTVVNVEQVSGANNNTKIRVTMSERLKPDANGKFGVVVVKDLAGNTIGSFDLTTEADAEKFIYETAEQNLLGGYDYRYVNVQVNAGYADLVGNAGDASIVYRLYVEKDKVAPAFKEIKLSEDRKFLIVVLSEKIDVATGANAVIVEYTANDGIVYDPETISLTQANLLDKDGKTTGDLVAIKVAPTKWLNDDGTLKIGTYTVKFAANAVKDLSAQENKNVAFTATIQVGPATTTVKDTTAPTLTFTKVGERLFEITSNEDLTLPTVANFKLDGNAMPEGTKVYFYLNKKTVRVELPYESITLTAPRQFTYSLADVAGNVTTKTEEVTIKENVRPQLASALLADPNLIVITASENLTGTPAVADFEVYVDGTKVTVSSVTVNNNKININLANAVSQTAVVKVKYVGSTLADTNANPLVNVELNVAR